MSEAFGNLSWSISGHSDFILLPHVTVNAHALCEVAHHGPLRPLLHWVGTSAGPVLEHVLPLFP